MIIQTSNDDFQQDYDQIVRNKILLVGDSGVGKSSILRYLLTGEFLKNIQLTVTVEFKTHMIINDGQKTRFQIWDIAGQDKFQSLSKLYVRGAHGVIVVFDGTQPKSLQKAIQWKKLLENYSEEINGEHLKLPFILVQNKVDLISQIRNQNSLIDNQELVNNQCFMSDIELELEVQNEGFSKVFSSSAKTGQNILEIFEQMAKEIQIQGTYKQYQDSYQRKRNNQNQNLNNKNDSSNLYSFQNYQKWKKLKKEKLNNQKKNQCC